MVCLHDGLTTKDRARVVLMTMTKEQLTRIILEAATERGLEQCASYYVYCIDTEYPPET